MSAVAEVRPSPIAGTWYEGQADPLASSVDGYIRAAKLPELNGQVIAVIAPHAGYAYSGPIAASAHAGFASARRVIKRIVVVGPSHYEPVDGLAVSSAQAFATPLGRVPVDTEAVRGLRTFRQVSVRDEAHAREHSLEVHLPFLQTVLGDFSIIPLVVGNASAEDVAAVLEALWDGPETRIVVSSDLSHYHDYDTARVLDLATSRAIEALRPQELGDEQACGLAPVRGLLEVARRRGLHVQTIDLRNSGDTAGMRDRVVGYGAFVFQESREEE